MSRSSPYDVVARAMEQLSRSDAPQRLEVVARDAGLSPFHFQRLFTRWAGVSPHGFSAALAAVRARRALQRDESVLGASLEAGLSGPSRLYDLFTRVEAMTPGEYARAAHGLTITWGVHETVFGRAVFASTPRGLCGLEFLPQKDDAERLLRQRWPGATLREARAQVKPVADTLNARIAGRPGEPLAVLLRGTAFQVKVWEALLRIPDGETRTYGQLAAELEAPRAARAVGSAVGDNGIAWLIPCHRVIRASGLPGDYRWGAERKAWMLAVEAGRPALRRPAP